MPVTDLDLIQGETARRGIAGSQAIWPPPDQKERERERGRDYDMPAWYRDHALI